MNSIPEEIKTFHPATGTTVTKIRYEYSIMRVDWRNGSTTFHLNTARVWDSGVRDKQDSWGANDSIRKATELGIDWAAAMAVAQ